MSNIDKEELYDWDAWGSEVVEAIRSGFMDRHLKAIVRAAVARKETWRVAPLKPADPFPGYPLIEKPTIKPAPSYMVRSSSAVFELDGVFYAKADVIGQHYRPDYRILENMRGVNWYGMTIRVLEINPKRVMYQVVNHPAQLTARLQTMVRSGIPFLADKVILRPILIKE